MPALDKEAIKAKAEKEGPYWLWCQSAHTFIRIGAVKTKNRQDYVVCHLLGVSAMDKEPRKIETKLDSLVSKGLYPLLRGSVFMGVLESDLRELLAQRACRAS
jgi:hypothetical protein